MELLPIVRRLWAGRFWLAAAAALAVIATVMAGPARTVTSAIAWTQVALDTPSSQLVDPAPKGADSLSWRASLMTRLMSTDATQRRLARDLGIRTDEVTVVDPVLAAPEVRASLPTRAADAAAVTAAHNVLTVEMRNSSLPVIFIEAAAPDAAGARRLAEAAVAILMQQAGREGRYASRIPAAGTRRYQPFAVQQVADIRVEPISSAEVSMRAPLPGVLFLLFCALVALMPRWAPRRRVRQTSSAAPG
jgi:hypothetical protein